VGESREPDRAILFVDGNNWYSFMKKCGVKDPMILSYATISTKLLGPRTWIATQYYIGAVKQEGNLSLYAEQRRFLASLTAEDSRITVHLGRVERREEVNPLADEVESYLRQPHLNIGEDVRNHLRILAKGQRLLRQYKEKAVDVKLAVDMVEQADRYDAAYLLSADGDFTPAVEAVRAKGKKVFAVAPKPGFSTALQQRANSFIQLDRDWFADCNRP